MANKQPVIDKYIVKCEQEILTSILNNPAVVDECALSLLPDDFADANNRAIYAVIYELYLATKQINYNIIVDYITNNPKSQFNNWESYLEELNTGFSYEDDLKSNIELVKNASIKRNLDVFANHVVETKIDFAKYNNQIWELEKEFMDIIQSKRTGQLHDMHSVVSEYYNKLNQLKNRSRDITGTPVGFTILDRVTNGFQPQDLIILAARPGVGKTAISLNFANNAAEAIRTEGKQDTDKVVIFSLEMGKDQLCQRLVAMRANVSASNLRSGRLDEFAWNNVKNELQIISELPILIDDTSDMSIVDIQSKLKQLRNKHNIRLVIVDYIQLLKGPRMKGAQPNRQQEVATISRMLKLLAREIQAPIIALAQLSRKIEERVGGKPMLSDLRESGSLEQDADLVCFLSRKTDNEKKEETTVKPVGPITKPEMQIITFEIAKHRNGELRTFDLSMNTTYGRFYDCDPNAYASKKEGTSNETK